jgi:hypothetical protein
MNRTDRCPYGRIRSQSAARGAKGYHRRDSLVTTPGQKGWIWKNVRQSLIFTNIQVDQNRKKTRKNRTFRRFNR